MSHGERLLELWAGAPRHPELDLALARVAGIGRPGVEVDGVISRLDRVADGASGADGARGIVGHVFERHGFSGDREDYYHPANSRLDEVIDRRLGIPITLSVVVMEVGRRHGVRIDGVGFPGHFLLRASTDDGDFDEEFFDPFDPRAPMSRAACRELFARLHGPRAVFDPSYLTPSDAGSIVTRVLNNLRYAHRRRGDFAGELDVLSILSRAPTAGASDVFDYACALADRGRYGHAVQVLSPYRDLDERIACSIDRWIARLN